MYTAGAFLFLVMVFLLYRDLADRRSKQKVYQSKDQSTSKGFLLVVSLGLIGYGFYSSINQQGIPPEILGYDFSTLLGPLTSLAQIVLHPLFSIGVFLSISTANNLVIGHRLKEEGLLTIPSNFHLQSYRDSDSDRHWRLTYQYRDGYQGEVRLSNVKFRKWQKTIDPVVHGNLTPEQVGHFMLVQYLSDTPGNHQLWWTEEFPQEAFTSSRRSMVNDPEEMGMLENIFANIARGDLPIVHVDTEPETSNVPVIEIKLGSGKTQSLVIKILFWGFIAALGLFLAYTQGWLSFLGL